MSVSLGLRVTGKREVQRALNRVVESTRDLRPALRAVLDDLRSGQRELFASRGREVGGWRPLSPGYAEWKARHYPGRGPLERTGRLRQEATDGLDVVLEPLRLHARITTPYAAYAARRRPLVALTEPRRRRAAEIVRGTLERAVAAAAKEVSP